jgi:DNA polymerase-3 subunit alpha
MAFLNVNDGTSEMEVTVFPKLFRQLNLEIEENEVYLISGKVTKSQYSQNNQILADKIELAKTVPMFSEIKKCYIKISEQNNQNPILNEIKHSLLKFKGDIPVILVFDSKRLLLEETFWVSEKSELTETIFKILGNNTIVFQ